MRPCCGTSQISDVAGCLKLTIFSEEKEINLFFHVLCVGI